MVKAVATEPRKVGSDGQPVPPSVVIDVLDLLQHPDAEAALADIMRSEPKLANHVKVMPEGRRVGAILSVPSDDGKSATVLGRVEFVRPVGTAEHRLRFPIDSIHAGLLAAKNAGQFQVEFEEDYLGDYQDDDLRITVINTRGSVQKLRTTIKRTAPDQKIAFVRFGGGANQETGLSRYLQSQRLFDMRYNAARMPNRELLDRFFSTVVPAALEKVKQMPFGAGDDDKVLTYIFSNGMTVQGTIAEFKKIDDKVRYEARRNAEDRRTWNRVTDSFRKGGGGGAVDVIGVVKVNGSGGSESRDITGDAGSEEAKRFSEDIADLFQAVEGKVPVLAMDIDQLIKAETAAADVVQAGLGQFRRGRLTIVHPVSFQTLYPEGTLPAYQTDADKRLAALEAKFAEAEKRRPFTGRLLFHHQTPENNPVMAELVDKDKAGTGRKGVRQAKQWVPFPEGRVFEVKPEIIVAVASVEAAPLERFRLRCSGGSRRARTGAVRSHGTPRVPYDGATAGPLHHNRIRSSPHSCRSPRGHYHQERILGACLCLA